MVPYPAAPRVVPQVELPFDIDANNTLNVCEQDKSNQTTITSEKIEATRKFIEKHCFNMQNSLSEEKLKDKFTRCDKKIIEKAVRETLGWLNENQLAKLDDIETKNANHRITAHDTNVVKDMEIMKNTYSTHNTE